MMTIDLKDYDVCIYACIIILRIVIIYNNIYNIMMINVKTAIVADILMMGSVCDGNGEKWTNSWSRRMINCCNTALSCNLLFVYDLFLCIFVTDCPKEALFW